MPNTAFVTGATGFLGLNLVEELARQGWRVLALHRASADLRYLQRMAAELVVGDITDVDSLLRALPQGTDAVFHVAGDTGLWSRHNARQDRVNIEGTSSSIPARSWAVARDTIGAPGTELTGTRRLRVASPAVSELFAAVVSIAPTKRRRFLWAAWWTAPPARDPFRRPDASEGGARTRDEAVRHAEQAAGRPLVQIEPLWARAWARVLMGLPPFTRPAADTTRAPPPADRQPPLASIWQILGLTPHATVPEIRAAFRQRALLTHPDRGGDPEAFRALRHAHDEALARRARAGKRPRRK